MRRITSSICAVKLVSLWMDIQLPGLSGTDSLTKLTLAQIHYKNMTPLKCHPPYIKDGVKIPQKTANRLWRSTFHSSHVFSITIIRNVLIVKVGSYSII